MPKPRARKTAAQKVELAAPKLAGLSGQDLARAMFSAQVRYEDLFRTYYGGSVDMIRIEQALLGANVGQMRPLTDLSREMVDRDPQISSLLLRR